MPHAPSWQSKLDFAPMRCTRSSTLALALALGVAAQHGARRRRHQEAAATHGVAADDDPRGPPDDHELWLRSSGAVNAEGKGLLLQQLLLLNGRDEVALVMDHHRYSPAFF